MSMVSIPSPVSLSLSLSASTNLSLEVQEKDEDLLSASLEFPLWSTFLPLFSLLPNEPQQQINGQG